MASLRVELEREKLAVTQASAGSTGGGLEPRSLLAPAQRAYAAGLLCSTQFAEIESLQTEDSLTFVADGAWPPARATCRLIAPAGPAPASRRRG